MFLSISIPGFFESPKLIWKFANPKPLVIPPICVNRYWVHLSTHPKLCYIYIPSFRLCKICVVSTLPSELSFLVTECPCKVWSQRKYNISIPHVIGTGTWLIKLHITQHKWPLKSCSSNKDLIVKSPRYPVWCLPCSNIGFFGLFNCHLLHNKDYLENSINPKNWTCYQPKKSLTPSLVFLVLDEV